MYFKRTLKCTGFPGGSDSKESASMQEIWVWFLDWEDPLEKEMATHSSILAWRISWTEGPGGLQSTGLQRVGHSWATNTHTQVHTAVLLTAGTMLDSTSLEFTHPTWLTLYTYWTAAFHFHIPAAPGSHHSFCYNLTTLDDIIGIM